MHFLDAHRVGCSVCQLLKGLDGRNVYGWPLLWLRRGSSNASSKDSCSSTFAAETGRNIDGNDEETVRDDRDMVGMNGIDAVVSGWTVGRSIANSVRTAAVVSDGNGDESVAACIHEVSGVADDAEVRISVDRGMRTRPWYGIV